ISDFVLCEEDYCEVDAEFCWSGNRTQFAQMNEILRSLVPMVKLYREKKIPEEAFQMIVNGYMEQLPNK
ncbi:MAG: hypothetical protein ACI3W5_03820, partial [Faecousia sp.]